MTWRRKMYGMSWTFHHRSANELARGNRNPDLARKVAYLRRFPYYGSCSDEKIPSVQLSEEIPDSHRQGRRLPLITATPHFTISVTVLVYELVIKLGRCVLDSIFPSDSEW